MHLVVLARSVLRSNALNTGQLVIRRHRRNDVFIVAAGILIAVGTDTCLLWRFCPRRPEPDWRRRRSPRRRPAAFTITSSCLQHSSSRPAGRSAGSRRGRCHRLRHQPDR
jgi:hypothetical protein